MGGLSIWHWMIVLLVVLLLFGTGKVSSLMGDIATGMKAFKKNMKDDECASMETAVDRPIGAIAPPTEPAPLTTIRERGNVPKSLRGAGRPRETMRWPQKSLPKHIPRSARTCFIV